MAIKIMKKPYHIVATKEDGTVAWTLTATPPALHGPAEDGKNGMTESGQFIRVFTVTDAGDSPKSVGDKISTLHTPGEFPTAEVDGLKLTVACIAGVKAAKPRKPKAEEDPMDGVKASPVKIDSTAAVGC